MVENARFVEKTSVVTGGTTGMGFATANRLANPLINMR